MGDSPSNTTDILGRQDEDDPMLDMLSNTNQQLPDYSDLIPANSLNSANNRHMYKSNQPGSFNESSPKKKTYKSSTTESREKKKAEQLTTNTKQVILSNLFCIIRKSDKLRVKSNKLS